MSERITICSPKTTRHEGHEERVIPQFPELRPHLQAVLDKLLEDFDPKEKRLSEQPVITGYRDGNSDLRTQLLPILRKAGLKPWPKLFQNLRATRATELAEEFPAGVAAEWLGHSTAIADKHYRQTTDAHFGKATGQPAQKAAQGKGTDRNTPEPECDDPGDFDNRRDSVVPLAPPVGLERVTTILHLCWVNVAVVLDRARIASPMAKKIVCGHCT